VRREVKVRRGVAGRQVTAQEYSGVSVRQPSVATATPPVVAKLKESK
jgi:hypothetical protein